MKYKAVQERLDLDLAALKTYLGIIVNDLDPIIELALSTAKQAADNYMNNPFKETNTTYISDQKSGEGVYFRRSDLRQRQKFNFDAENSVYEETNIDIPESVKLGCIEYVRGYLQATQHQYDVYKEKEGDLTRDYRDLGLMEKYIKETYWKQYKVFWL